MRDGGNDRCRPRLDIVSREPEHRDTFLVQPGGTTSIAFRLFDMGGTIHRDTKPQRRAVKVENIRTNWMLAPKVPALVLAPQQRPQRLLRLGHGAAQYP